MNNSEILKFMHDLCDEAAETSLKYFNSENISVRNKSDIGFDPVTDADIACEEIIIARIRDKFPDHGVLSEENNPKVDKSIPHWVIDPIDGTRAFISGVASWGTLICYNNGKEPTLGILDKPYAKERYFSDGFTSFIKRNKNISEIKTSNKKKLDKAILSSTDPYLFKDTDEKKFKHLLNQVNLSRWGLDCTAYALLASGKIDLVVENNLNAYDIQAIIPIIRGSGGVISTWNREDPSNGGSVIAACNNVIYEEAIKLLRD